MPRIDIYLERGINVWYAAFLVFLIINFQLFVLSADKQAIKPLISREKIYISNNIGFQEFPGSGTEEDPYVIAGFEINSPVSGDDTLITIEGTNAYFVIENNILTGNDQNSGSGISIVSVSNGLIQYNEIRDTSKWGIFIAGSENILVEYNIIRNNKHQGLELLSSVNNVIQHNIITSSGANGIASYFSSNNAIINNTVSSNSGNGIHIEEGVMHNIKENRIDNNQAGLWVGGGIANIIDTNKISSNAVGITFRDQTQLGNNPSDRNDVRNNLIFNNIRGIEISNGNNNTFSQNIIDGSDGNGIQFNGGVNNSIIKNVISNNEYGYNSRGSSSNNTINCNSFEVNRGFGVIIENDPTYNKVFRNDFIGNQVKPQASDSGFSNTFEQNFWDEIGTQNQENVGTNDLQYALDGSAGTVDLSSSPVKNTDLSSGNSFCDLGLEIQKTIQSIENITTPLELEARLEFPISRSTLIGFSLIITLLISIVLFYKLKNDINL